MSEKHGAEAVGLRERSPIGLSERTHFMLLSAQGYSPPQIGQLFGYKAATVRAWLRSYQGRGIAGLNDTARSGRLRKEKRLTGIVQAQASQPPPNFGYLPGYWTIARLALHLVQHFRLKVSASILRRALHAARFRWKRPKLAPARRPDPLAAAKRTKLAEVLAQPEATLITSDECDLHLLPVLRAMWQRLGQQMRLITPGQNGKRGVFGALNLRTGEWFYQVTEPKGGSRLWPF